MKPSRNKCRVCKHSSGEILKECDIHNTKNTYYLNCIAFEDKRDLETILREQTELTIKSN